MIGIRAEKFDVLDLDRPVANDTTGDAGYRIHMSRPVHRFARVVDIDSAKRCRNPVRIAFATNFAIGDDVDARPFHVADREQGCIVLGVFEQVRVDAPHFECAHPRWKASFEVGAINQPFRLNVTSDDGGGQQFLGHVDTFSVSSKMRRVSPLSD